MRGTLTGGSVGLLRYPAMLPCFSRLWGMILHCRKSPCRLEITADSRGLASGFSCLGDHPRVCGEHEQCAPPVVVLVGSSPRMRGTLQDIHTVDGVHGIIPAYAGNTAASIPQVSASWDHPRVCGEHQWQVHDNPMPLGSSPRMRGTLKRVHRHRHATRIIPAYAGNTTARNASTKAKRDHPRVCGEHTLPVSFMLPVLGSSPRMRGTQTMQIRIQPQGGIIPAYAGNTTTTSASSLLCRDHPRVYGKH